jgi:hypothetical protein
MTIRHPEGVEDIRTMKSCDTQYTDPGGVAEIRKPVGAKHHFALHKNSVDVERCRASCQLAHIQLRTTRSTVRDNISPYQKRKDFF